MYRRAKVDSMGFGRTKVDPLNRRATLDPIMYRRTKVDPMGFGRTKVNPLKVGELLSILQCIGKLRSILWVSGELRSIP